MPQPPETRESVRYAANLFIQRLAPRQKGPRGTGVAITFWSGEVTDVSELECSHIIEVSIGGEKKFVNCSWPAGSVRVGDYVEGRVDEVGQYWVIALIGASLAHLHAYSDPLAGVVDGMNVTFATTFAYETDKITVSLNGLAYRRDEYIQVDNRYIQTNIAPLPGDELQADYQLGYPSASIGDGKYVIAADYQNGKVARCQDIFAAAPVWEDISQQADFGALSNVLDIIIPPWAPAGMAFLCGSKGVWRTSNLGAANPADVLWTLVLSAAEITSVLLPVNNLYVWEFAVDEDTETIYLATAGHTAVTNRQAVFRTSNLGQSWTASSLITLGGGDSYGQKLIGSRLEEGVGGNIYFISQSAGTPGRDRIFRSINGGQTFPELINVVEGGEWGAALAIHRAQATDNELAIINWGVPCAIAGYCTDGSFNFNVAAGLPESPSSSRAFQYDPNDKGRLYAALKAGNADLYLSTDQGQNYSKLADLPKPPAQPTQGTPSTLKVFERNSNYLYVGFKREGLDINGVVIDVSTDGGSNFTIANGNYYAIFASNKPWITRIIPVRKVTS